MTDVTRLVIFGRQGAGKGTQCDRIIDHFGVIHLSTGDMFRVAVAAETELGKQVEPIMQSGGLVPDEMTIGIVRERLSQPDVESKGFVLDGFPRTPGQAEALVEMLGDARLTAVINLDVPLDEVTARMKARDVRTTPMRASPSGWRSTTPKPSRRSTGSPSAAWW